MSQNWGEKLPRLWRLAGISSQTEFAQACGIDESTVSKIVRGKYSEYPTGHILSKMAGPLRIPVKDLLPMLVEDKPGDGSIEDLLRQALQKARGSVPASVAKIRVLPLECLVTGEEGIPVRTIYYAPPEGVEPEHLAAYSSPFEDLEQIPPGAILIVNSHAYQGGVPKHNDIVVYVAGDQYGVARVKQMGDTFTLANTRGRMDAADARIFGKLIAWEVVV